MSIQPSSLAAPKRRRRPSQLTAFPWIAGALAIVIIAASVVIAKIIADEPAASPPPACVDITLPGQVLTDAIVDRGCTESNGTVFIGATYRCTDGRRLWAAGYRVWGFVGEPLQRGDGTLNGYAHLVSECLS